MSDAPSRPDQVDGFPHPREQDRLIGHADAEQTLLSAYAAGRLHHGWLITGPRGIGKATLAYRFARFLLAQGAGGGGLFGPPDSLAVDPADPTFGQIAAEGHGNLFVLTRRLNEKARPPSFYTVIRVDEVRALSPFLAQTAHQPGWRAVIVDATDDMNVNAQNALLKMLEEPPAETVFLLVSHAPGRLLPTIRSRCRRLALSPLTDDQVMDVMTAQCPDMAEDELRALASLGEGSPGRALALAAQGGLEVYREMIDLLAGMPKLDAAKLHGLGDRLARKANEARYRALTDLLDWWLMRLIRGRAAGHAPAEIVAGEGAVIARLAAAGSLDQWIEVWEKVGRLVERADAVNLDRKAVTLNLFTTLEQAARG